MKWRLLRARIAGLGDGEEREADHRDDEGQEAGDQHLDHAALVEVQDLQLLPAAGQACLRQKR